MRKSFIAVSSAFIAATLTCLTGCASNTEEVEVSETSSEASSQPVGTGGVLIPIDSDNVTAAGYDASSQIMTVQFDSGWTYEYYGVSLDVWNKFVVAQPNPWSRVGYPLLVQSGIPYKRVG